MKSQDVKFRDRKENGNCQRLGEVGTRSFTLMNTESRPGRMRKVLERGGEGSTARRTHSMPLSTYKWSRQSTLHYVYFTTTQKFKNTLHLPFLSWILLKGFNQAFRNALPWVPLRNIFKKFTCGRTLSLLQALGPAKHTYNSNITRVLAHPLLNEALLRNFSSASHAGLRQIPPPNIRLTLCQ